MNSQNYCKGRCIVIGIGFLFFASLIFWFFRPSANYDVRRVEPRLRALQTPYQNVKTSYYLDGGSVGIEIVDRDGKLEQFAIPAYLGDTNRYTKVFVGAMHARKPGAIEVADSKQTKRMLIKIIATMPNRTADDDFSLMTLRRRPSDFAICLVHKWTGKYNP